MATIDTSIWGPLRTDESWQTVLGEDVHYTQTVGTTLSTGNDKHEPLDNSVCIFGFGYTSPAVHAVAVSYNFTTEDYEEVALFPDRAVIPWALAWTNDASHGYTEWESGYPPYSWVYGNNYRWVNTCPTEGGHDQEENLGVGTKPSMFITNDFDYQRKWMVFVKPVVLETHTVDETEYKEGKVSDFTTLKDWYDNHKDKYQGICQIIIVPTNFSNNLPEYSGGFNFSLFAEIVPEMNIEYPEGNPRRDQQKIDGNFYAYRTYTGAYSHIGGDYFNGYMTIAGGRNVRDDGNWNLNNWTPLFMPTVGDWSVHCILPTHVGGVGVGWGFFAGYNPGQKTYDEVEDEIAKIVAHMGTFFIFDMADKNRPNDHNNVFLGLLDENAVSTGNYSRGEANRDSDQFNWDKAGDANYDPDYNPEPPEPGDDPSPSGDPMLPTGLDWTLATAGGAIWALDNSDIREVWNDIFGKDIKLKDFGDNPMNAILSLEWTPFIWTSDTSGPIVLGSQVVNPNHVYPIIESAGSAEVHGEGQMRFKFNKNFYNARNMQARLFLPFYGYYELPTAQLLSSQLRLDFYYNVPDELGVYIISYDKVIYDFVECSCKIDIPLTGSNAAALRENKRAEALTIATQVASMAATVMAGYAGGHAAIATGALVADSPSVISALGGREMAASWGSQLASAGVAAKQAGVGIAAASGGSGIVNTIHNAQIQRAALKTNLPYHGSALQTTFLHMSMKPYVQIFKNAIISGLKTDKGGTVKVELGDTDEEQYKLKVGHTCDKFCTIQEMDEGCLLQTTGCANMSSMGMELSEYQELNSILQSGFYK